MFYVYILKSLYLKKYVKLSMLSDRKHLRRFTKTSLHKIINVFGAQQASNPDILILELRLPRLHQDNYLIILTLYWFCRDVRPYIY